MTLVELLVATVLTLLLVAAIAEGFSAVTSTISANRATIELSNRMRETTARVQEDLSAQTVPMLPWTLRSAGMGYFEYVEGPASDLDADNSDVADVAQTGADTSIGDVDDVIMFTARSEEELFSGQVLGTVVAKPGGGYRLDYDPTNPVLTTIYSEFAEIVWWTTYDYQDTNADGVWNSGEPIQVRLFRRVLLIRPDIEIPNIVPPSPPNYFLQPSNPEMPDVFFFSANDLSVRTVGGVRYANSLQDLTRRETRFAHNNAAFPNPLLRAALLPKRSVWQRGPDGAWGSTNDDDGDGTPNDLDEAGWSGSDDILVYGALGTDVMLNDVLAFDVKVFDPFAPVICEWDVPNNRPDGDALTPGEPGFATIFPAFGTTTQRIGYGAFVDLGYLTTPYAQKKDSTNNSLWDRMTFLMNNNTISRSFFYGFPATKSQLSAAAAGKSYCTWSLHYESDGVNQNGGTLVDEGTDGLDNDSANGVDDPDERETSPPYPEPLRGLQVRVRVIDPDSRQVRQMTVVSNFTPE
jgi:hypothetical protein